MKRQNVVITLLVLCSLALLLRVGAIAVFKPWTPAKANAIEHRQIAINLVNGNGFAYRGLGSQVPRPSSVQSPPYPLLLATTFKLFGIDAPAAYISLMILNALFGALTVWLTYLLAKTMGGNDIVALIAAGLCAVWPSQIYPTTYAQAIVIITAGIVAMIVLFYRAVRSAKLAPWIGFSVIGMLAALTEPVLLPVMVLSGLLVLGWRGLAMPIRLRNAAVLFVTAVVIVGPWSLRNRSVHGQWIPIKSTFWVNFWKGNNDFASGTDRVVMTDEQRKQFDAGFSLNDDKIRDKKSDIDHQYDRLTPEEMSRLTNQPEAEQEKIFKDISSTWVSSHHQRYVELCGLRLAKSLWYEWDNPKSANKVYIASRTLLVVLSAIGLILALVKRWSLLYPAIVFGLCLLTFTLTITAARFSIPLEPIQFCLAGLVMGMLIPQARRESDALASSSATTDQLSSASR